MDRRGVRVMSNLICFWIFFISIIILVIKAYGNYVQGIWDSMVEVPHRQEEIKRYSVEEIKQFNDMYENVRNELSINKGNLSKRK
jgi:hypothetical protein